MRAFGLAALLLLGGCMTRIELSNPPTYADSGLAQAARNYPPLLMGANTRPADGTPPRACPRPGARVEQKGGPTLTYLGASPANPDLCRFRADSDSVEAYYGIWQTDWGGVNEGYRALKRIFQGHTGDVEAFDVVMGPANSYHDLIRNEGVEDINLVGHTYRAMKVSHYREGFNGNIYRSVSTVWKDMDSGMIVYATYQHISGIPVVDDPLIPTRIVP